MKPKPSKKIIDTIDILYDWVSSCCRDQLIVVSGDEGTSHWECRACGKACDAWVDKKTKQIEDWEKEFDEKFISRWNKNTTKVYPDISQSLKNFIRQILSSQKQDLKKKIEEWSWGRGCDDCTNLEDLQIFLKTIRI